jgi:hypothetical protein
MNGPNTLEWNMILGSKGILATNTLAFWAHSSVTKKFSVVNMTQDDSITATNAWKMQERARKALYRPIDIVPF